MIAWIVGTALLLLAAPVYLWYAQATGQALMPIPPLMVTTLFSLLGMYLGITVFHQSYRDTLLELARDGLIDIHTP